MSAYTDGKAAVLYWSDEFNLTIVSQEENKIVLRGEKGSITAEWNGAVWSVESEVPAYKNALVKALVSEPAESPKTAIKPARHTSAPPATRNAANGRQDESPVDTWRKKQDRTYSVEGGKTVPNAFAASEEANRRRFDVEVDSGRSETVAWGKARAIDPETGRYREAKVSFEWSTFRQRTAWEIVRNMERREPGILQGIDDVTMLPILAPRQYKGQPASLYLHLQILNRWTFADRDAESKAERRAILKLANQEWRDDDEVESERGEERAVREAEP